MTTPKDKLKPWESPLPALPESEEELLPTFRCGNPALRERFGRPDSEPPDLSRFEPRPATDWLAVFGVGAAVIAFLLWALPRGCGDPFDPLVYCVDFFSADRLPAVAAFLALSFILLLLRRR